MRENNIPSTDQIAKIENQQLFDNKNILLAKNKNKIKTEFIQIINKHTNVFVKPDNSNQGRGIFKIDKDNLYKINEINFNKTHTIEKTINQHNLLSEMNPNCINTLRVITVRKNDEIHIPNCLLRLGTGVSNVDNAASGGIFIN